MTMAVFCSAGPENGYRIKLASAFGPDRVTLQVGEQTFRWDGTYDEHGDARFVPDQTTVRSSSS